MASRYVVIDAEKWEAWLADTRRRVSSKSLSGYLPAVSDAEDKIAELIAETPQLGQRAGRLSQPESKLPRTVCVGTIDNIQLFRHGGMIYDLRDVPYVHGGPVGYGANAKDLFTDLDALQVECDKRNVEDKPDA
jgi:hypothetical protein